MHLASLPDTDGTLMIDRPVVSRDRSGNTALVPGRMVAGYLEHLICRFRQNAAAVGKAF